MKTNDRSFALRVSVAAVRGALFALALTPVAHADDSEPTVKELTSPTSTVEAGTLWNSRDSYKFGEYNGLYHKGFYGIGNLDLRGGDAYDSNGTSRWRLFGSDLGTDERSAKAEYGWQGLFRISLGYDELLRSQDDRYHSPLVGVGGTNLTLPSNWNTPMYLTGPIVSSAGVTGLSNLPTLKASNIGLAATSLGSPLVTGSTYYICPTTSKSACTTTPGALQTVGFSTLAANNPLLNTMLANNARDFADLSNGLVPLSTKRQKFDVAATYDLDPRSNIAFSFREEHKDGMQQLGVVNAAGTGPAASGNNAATLASENSVIIPKLIDTMTDQYNLSYNVADKKSFFTAAYYGSIFTNKVKSMTVADPWGTATTLGTTTFQAPYGPSSATISEEPDNQLHQFRLTAGYDILSSTKIVGDASYSRNTQNDHFVYDPSIFATPTLPSGAPLTNAALGNGAYSPVNTANAVVVEKAFDFKLTSRPFKRVDVSAAYKYDNRDNQTPVNTYVYYDAGDQKQIGAGNNTIFGAANGTATTASIPGLPPGLALYNNMNVVSNRPYSKTVNQADLDANVHLAPGQAIKVGYELQRVGRYCNGTWIDCSYADQSRENTAKFEYRFTALETVSGRLAYDYSTRSVTYNPNAWMSLVPGINATNVPTLTAQGWSGSVLGFMNTYGLTANGLPLPTTGIPTLTPVTASSLTGAQALAIYKLLYGVGNGSLSNSYYLNHNITNNWAGLDVYNMSNRDRNRVRGSLNWQTTETLALQGGFDYRHDDYPDNQFGLLNGEAWSLNFDAAFTPNENYSLDGYYTHEDQKTQSTGRSSSNGSIAAAATNVNGNTTVAGPGCFNTYSAQQINQKLDPCSDWGANIHDRADTVGLSILDKKLVSRKLSLAIDSSFTREVTANNMTGGFYYNNSLASANLITGGVAAYFIPTASLPDVVTTISHVGVSGRYILSKQSAVRMSYSVNWFHTDDYTYSTTQPGAGVAQVMPTLDTAQNYVVHVVGVSYVYSFQ